MRQNSSLAHDAASPTSEYLPGPALAICPARLGVEMMVLLVAPVVYLVLMYLTLTSQD